MATERQDQTDAGPPDGFPDFNQIKQPATKTAAPEAAPDPSVQYLGLAPEPSPQERLLAIRAARNPLLEAAQPLLRALADMPETLGEHNVSEFQEMLVQAVTLFQSQCAGAKIKHEHAIAASYVLCTALDERVASTSWGGGSAGHVGPWAQMQLARQLHGDIEGGDKFFLLLGRLVSAPQEHTDLIELMYTVLGLGFEGRYGTGAEGRQQLETIRHRLYLLLTSARGEVSTELSPHWKGVGEGKFRMLHSVPVWFTAALVALGLLGFFGWYKYHLVRSSARVEETIRAIGAMRPPAQPPRVLRLKELLASEIERGTVSVEEDAAHSAVTFKGDRMFVPGKAQLEPAILPVVAKVAGEINEVSGTVQVVGHTDNRPIKTQEFPNNQALSEKRAEAVAEVLKRQGVVSDRIVVEGKGDTQPVASNANEAGRALNRRVDIVVRLGAAAPGAPAPRPAAAPASKPAAN